MNAEKSTYSGKNSHWLRLFAVTYSIGGGTLTCRSLFLKRTILINDIKSISYSSFPAAGLHICDAFKGLKIYYLESYLVFISPAKAEDFIAHLLSINPAIKMGT